MRPQPDGVVWRAPAAADASTLAAFWRDRYVETFANLYSAQDLNAFLLESYSPARIAAEVADPRFVHRLVERGGAIIAGFKGGAVGLPLPPSGELWELHRLYLTPGAQGSGLADALMVFAHDQARAAGAQALVLGVFSENHRALRFYARHGFRQIATYDFMVGDHRDLEFIMEKRPI